MKKQIKVLIFAAYSTQSPLGIITSATVSFDFDWDGTSQDYIDNFNKKRKHLIDENSVFLSFSVIKTFEEEIS
jgi:hypothetical protein